MENQWTESNSELYQQLAAVAVPERVQQIATILTLLPFSKNATFRIAELASGEGYLSAAILAAFPKAQLIALDGSDAMRQTTARRLAAYEGRFRLESFDMMQADWYSLINGVDCVVSSLCIHHLDDKQKEKLYADLYQQMSERGALLIADLVMPQGIQARELFSATWDKEANKQASASGKNDLYDLFQSEHWNYYRYPDDFDKPSTLFDQLKWLSAAGFETVDCFWMLAGHAIFGGYKTGQSSVEDSIRYEDAYAIAQKVLES